ncbi:transcription termination factor NusA [Ureaplasma diversum]|uniref:transcription termination factor NusA n=1 Tax=Ureaplasma diversum TaxID=42094 RepID=UPI000A8E6E37|nr:transcription termination factor NusA [Ureaplasma diversum]
MAKINSKELADLIPLVANDKDLPVEDVAQVLKEAFEKAYHKNSPDGRFEVKIDLEKGTIDCYEIFTVVEDEKSNDETLETGFDDIVEILLSEAKKINPDAKVGDLVYKTYPIEEMKPSQVLQISQLFKQRITELHNAKVADYWRPQIGKVIYAKVVEQNERRINNTNQIYGYHILLEDKWNTQGFLSVKEKIGDEELKLNHLYHFVIKDVKEQSRLWPVLLTRNDPDLLEAIIKREILDVREGVIKIEKIVRSAGIKSKVAVSCYNPNINPVTTILGIRGSTINSISKQLNNERIDIVQYSDDIVTFLANAIGVDKIVSLIFDPNEQNRAVTLITKEQHIPSIVGRGGVNIRLISKLVGYSIDVKSDKQAHKENISYTVFDQEQFRRLRMQNLHKNTMSNDDVLAIVENYRNEINAQTQEEESLENLSTNHQEAETKPIQQPVVEQKSEPVVVENNDSEADDEDIEVLEGFEDLIDLEQK